MLINYNKLVAYYEKITNTEKFSETLIKLGFERISIGTFTDVFRYKKHPLVIKVACRGEQALPTLSKKDKRLQEYFVGYKYLSLDSVVGVQDFVEEYLFQDSDIKKSLYFLTKFRKKYDIHIGNIGLFNGKPVVFDF